MAFERPSNPSNVWACLRTIDAFGCQDVHIVEDSLEEAAKRAAARGVHADPTQRMRGRKKRMTSAMGAHLRVLSCCGVFHFVEWLSLEAHGRRCASVGGSIEVRGSHRGGHGLVSGSGGFWRGRLEEREACLGLRERGGRHIGGIAGTRGCQSEIADAGPRGVAEFKRVGRGGSRSRRRQGSLVPDLTVEERDLLLLRWSLLSVRAGRELLRRSGVELDQGVSRRARAC